MRITNNMITNNVLMDANRNLYNQNKIFSQITSGKQFQRPSDNPILVARSMKITSQIAENDQFQRNVDDSVSMLDKTETSLNEITDIMDRMRELTVQASNGTNTPEDTQKMKEEMEQLRDQIVKISNDTYMGRRIFNGYDTDSDVLNDDGTLNMEGYTENAGPPAQLIGPDGNVVTYTDDKGVTRDVTSKQDYYNNVLPSQDIKYQVGINTELDVNITADQVFGPAVPKMDADGNPVVDKDGNQIYEPSIVRDMDKIINDMETGDSEDLSKDIDTIDTYVNGGMVDTDNDGTADKKVPGLLQLRADVGAKCNTAETVQGRIEDTGLNMTKLLSETEDTNMQEAYMQMVTMQSVYQASLSVGAKIIQPTLVDFLR